MTLNKYLIIQQILMAMIIVLGCHLIFEKVPDEVKESRIHLASRVIGVTALVIPIASFIYFFTGLQCAGACYATAINLSAYSVSSTLLATTYYILLDKISNKPALKAHLITGIIYPLPLWIGLKCFSTYTDIHILTAFYTLFAVMVIIHIISCYVFYNKEIESFKTNRSRTKKQELQLVGKTIRVSTGMVVISLMSPSFFSYPMWLGMIFVCLFIVGATYVYVCFRRALKSCVKSHLKAMYKDKCVEVELYDNDEEEELISEVVPLNEDIKQSIEKNLQEWLNKKGYTDASITIQIVAKAIYTNRTYLSRYINNRYNCSFRVWVSQLRIEESKQLLMEHEELSISEIAKQVGFASTESFSHIFNRAEHCTPTKWRENYISEDVTLHTNNQHSIG